MKSPGQKIVPEWNSEQRNCQFIADHFQRLRMACLSGCGCERGDRYELHLEPQFGVGKMNR